MDNKEMWKPIVGFESKYEISSLGRGYSLPRDYVDSIGRHVCKDGHFMKIRICTQTGYPQVNLFKDGKSKPYSIHRLIAEAFIPNPNNYPCINHIDENRANSVLNNLEWCTYKYNSNYGTARQKRADKMKQYYLTHDSPIRGHRGHGFAIIKYNLEGKVIARIEGGLPELQEREGRRFTSIASCLCHKNKTAYGYVWRYDGDPFDYVAPKYNKGKRFPKTIKAHQKYVIKKDLSGNIIERYNSVSKAAEANGFDRHCLSRKRKEEYTINGFIYTVEKKENEYIPTGHKGPRPDLKGKGIKTVIRISPNGERTTFKGIKYAAEAIGKPNGGPDITNCCKGNIATAYGYKWKHSD